MRPFSSVLVKLAIWYLFILMAVSLLFSLIIFQVAHSEIASRLTSLATHPEAPLSQLEAQNQLSFATASLIVSLGYVNFIVLLAGGAGAYLLARRTLRPIEEAHAAQSRFVANASHQFRTPLAIIKAETELALSDKKASATELRATLRSTLEEVDHLSILSSMLLQLSQNRQDFSESTDKIELSKLVYDIVKRRGITKRAELHLPGSLYVYSYEPALREVVDILVDNAIKHGKTGAKITIELRQEKTQAILTISNQGGHLPETSLLKVFERFYSTRETEGYGLGLPLAKQLVEVLGGQVSLANLPAKKGVSATLNLPLK